MAVLRDVARDGCLHCRPCTSASNCYLLVANFNANRPVMDFGCCSIITYIMLIKNLGILYSVMSPVNGEALESYLQL